MKGFLGRALVVGACFVSAPALAGEGAIVEADPINLMNLNFHFRFLPTQAEINRVRERMTAAGEMICDATDGQVRFGAIKLSFGEANEAAGDIWFMPDPGRSTSAVGPALGTSGAHILLQQDDLLSNTIAHELGHLAFGLGDEYGEQRRFGGSCGIGQGFDGQLTEQRHSIMEEVGSTQCSLPDPANPGLFLGQGTLCQVDGDCPMGQTCEPILSSEFPVAENHDVLRGSHASCADIGESFNPCCNMAAPTTLITLSGRLDETSPTTSQPVNPAPPFDPTTFATAMATSAGFATGFEFLDASVGKVAAMFGVPESHRFWVFFEHLATDTWRLHFVMDGREFDPPDAGTEPTVHVIETAELSLATAIPVLSDPIVNVVDLLTGGDIDVTINVAGLFETTIMQVSGAANGQPMCADDMDDPTACLRAWNSNTSRYEGTQQTQINNESDWETIVRHFPFVAEPAGLPNPVMPAGCTKEVNPPTFDATGIFGSDQVAMVIDRSGSMAAVIEPNSTQTRLQYAQAAGRVFAQLRTGDPNVSVGLISFDDIVQSERPIAPITTANAPAFLAAIDALTPRNSTAIGDALLQAITELGAVRTSGRSQTILLLSDGQQNTGSDPRAAKDEAVEEGIRIFTVPVGDAADRQLLSEIAGESGGATLDAPIGDELPPIYLELDARTRGYALVLERTASTTEAFPDPSFSIASTPTEEEFPIHVEANARTLQVLASARHVGWNPAVTLTSPSGVVRQRGSAGVVSDPFFVLFRLQNPQPGIWKLKVRAGSGLQRSFVSASIDNSLPDCFADAKPRISRLGDTVAIDVKAAFTADLVSGVEYSGSVRRPDGSVVPLTFTSSLDANTNRALFSDFAGRGSYRVNIGCVVEAGARVHPGEAVFGGPENTGVADAFRRSVTTSFFHDVATQPPLPPGNDCDGDGIPNADEAPGDTDHDGLPDICDGDGDGDDVPDPTDPDPEDPNVPRCSTEPRGVACCSNLASCPGKSDFALFANNTLRLADRASSRTVSGGFASIANAGPTETNLGVDSRVGNVHSRASVVARDRTRVTGTLRTSGTLTRQNGVVITGGFAEHATLSFPDLAAFSMTFPRTNLGDRNVAPGATLTLAPGSYRNVTVGANARLNLRSGTYFFESLRLEPGSEARFTITTGPAFMYTRSACQYRGRFVDLGGRHDRVLWACLGTQDVPVERPLSGTLVAPRAKVLLGSGGPQTHRGAVFAKNIDVAPDMTVELRPFVSSWGAGAPTMVHAGTADGSSLLDGSSVESPPEITPSTSTDAYGGCAIGAPGRRVSGFGYLALAGATLVVLGWRKRRRVLPN